MQSILDPRWLVFVQVAELGSLAKVATAMDVPPSMVSQAMGGCFKGPIGDCRWAYYDTRPFIGRFTELYYVDGQLPARLDDLKWGIQASVTGK